MPNITTNHAITYTNTNTLFFFFYKNIVFLDQAEYSRFPVDFRLKILLTYS